MLLNIENLSAGIEEKKILENFSLTIKPGETHVIMGPNGSGKSTLTKILAGHPSYQVQSGKITYTHLRKEIDLLTIPAFERSLMGLFLSFQYPVEIPGVSNLDFLKEAYQKHCEYQGSPHLTDADFLSFLKPLMKKLQIAESFLERSVNEGFSGGEKKKNEILQLLALQPKLAILDETDSGLDIDSLKIVAEGVNHYKSKNNALLLVTHYQRLLNYIVPDFVHIMSQGKIIKSGDASLAKKLELHGYDLAAL